MQIHQTLDIEFFEDNITFSILRIQESKKKKKLMPKPSTNDANNNECHGEN